MNRNLVFCSLLLLQVAVAHNHHEHEPSSASVDSSLDEITKRWAPFGDPYQERLVSMLPGSNYPSPVSFDYPPQPQPQPPYIPPLQYYPQQPPAAPVVGSPIVLPVITNQEKQEQNSKDLDVGVYTGMDIPWTHIPPFSTTYKAGMGAQTPPPLMQPSAYPFGGYYGAAQAPPPPPQMMPTPRPYPMDPYFPEERMPYPSWYPRRNPYPYMRQQGGFAVNRGDDDVKLMMHVPKDGPPGGVLVMEMKANVYRPVY